jgi:transposase
VGKTKRGKGSKIMAIADRAGFPVALYVSSASPNEVTLVERTLETCFTATQPERLIGDKAYDSDPLDEQLRARGIALIAPHRAKRRKPKTQDGRALRRFKRRWKVERRNAWLLNARRVVVRYDRDLEHYYGFVRLAGIRILMRRYF